MGLSVTVLGNDHDKRMHRVTVERYDKPQTNKQKTIKLDLPNIKIGCLYIVDRRLPYFLK